MRGSRQLAPAHLNLRSWKSPEVTPSAEIARYSISMLDFRLSSIVWYVSPRDGLPEGRSMGVDNHTANGRDELLRISNLRTYFYTSDGVIPAVDGIDLVIQRGKPVGLVASRDVEKASPPSRSCNWYRRLAGSCRDRASCWKGLTSFRSVPSRCTISAGLGSP